MICPAETPEGQACGLVKNLSLMTFVSVGAPSDDLIEVLTGQGVESLNSINPCQIKDAIKIFVNGAWIGIGDPDLVDEMKERRRSLKIPKEVSIVRDFVNKEIRFYTDSGRVQRPLFIVEGNKVNIKREHI